jgi:hypothetical protein
MSMSSKDGFDHWHSGSAQRAALVGDALYNRRSPYGQGVWAQSLLRLCWPSLLGEAHLCGEVEKLHAIAQGPADSWRGSRELFGRVRSQYLDSDLADSGMAMTFRLVEVVAKITFNSSGQVPRYDSSVGGQLGALLRALARSVEGFPAGEEVWEVMFHAGRGTAPEWSPFESSWLAQALAETGEIGLAEKAAQLRWAIEKGPGYLGFVDSERPNRLGSAWTHQRAVRVNSSPRGAIVVDVLSNSRVGGVEFLDEL